MKQWNGKMQDEMKTVSLTMLLALNLFGIVTAVSTVATALVLLEVDGGFLYRDGHIGVGGTLVFIYTVCIVIAVSIAVTMRTVFIHPMQKLVRSMNELAAGNFDVRIEQEKGYRPTEMRAFVDSFNKAAEQLGGTEILRKDFINNFSHEFKTPIVSINGFAELLLEDDEMPPEERQEYLTVIRDESKRLTALAANILTLNRIESQTILTDKETFPLDEQLRQSVLVTQQKWRDKALEFDADLPAASYTGSEALLKEVWLNLLDNAAKFSPEGGRVGVTLKREKNALTVCVTDQGEGMDAETQQHIFEQFYQGDTSHTTQGNGLGLSMVKMVLELHGGSIAVDSAPGQGSRFTVTL